MIQDLTNSENMNSTELSIPNIFKDIQYQPGRLSVSMRTFSGARLIHFSFNKTHS